MKGNFKLPVFVKRVNTKAYCLITFLKLCIGIAKAENYIHESKNKTTLIYTVGVKVFQKLKLLLFRLAFIH